MGRGAPGALEGGGPTGTRTSSTSTINAATTTTSWCTVCVTRASSSALLGLWRRPGQVSSLQAGGNRGVRGLCGRRLSEAAQVVGMQAVEVDGGRVEGLPALRAA